MSSHRRLLRHSIAFLALASLSCAGSSAADRAAEARTRLEASEGGLIVLRAIEAAGGLETWYAAPTSAYGFEYSNVQSNTRFKSFLVADNASRHIYHDLVALGTPDEVQSVEARFAWDGTQAWMWPAEVDGPNARFWSSTGYYFTSIPFVLADPGIRYEKLPDAELDGTVFDMAQVTYEDGVGDASDTYTLYVDKQTDRLRAIRYTVTYGGRPARGETLLYYDDWTTVDGLSVATHMTGYDFVDGAKADYKNEMWVTEISFTQPFDATRLVMPADARVQPLPEG